MPIHHILVLAIIQGVTEFLPVSSSGHLVLTGPVLGWPDQGLAMDVAVHLGSLLAVCVYFWRDIGQIAVGVGRAARGRGGPQVRLVGILVLATLPILAAGYLLKEHVETDFRGVELIGWTTLGFGILLWIADKTGMTIRRMEHIRWPTALTIGLAQILALLPGTSRSGITITAARFLGMERTDAARFSMLLSIPTILAAAGLKGWDVHQSGDWALTHDLLLAAGFSFFSALVAIALMMAWLRRAGFGPFVLYRIALGGALLYWVYG